MGFESILQLVKQIADKNKDDISKAKKEAVQRVREHPEFEDHKERLIDEAICTRVYESRHLSNRSAAYRYREETVSASEGGNRKQKYASNKPKTTQSNSKKLSQVYQELFDRRIDGRTIGSICGSEIPELIEQWQATGNGYLEVAGLLSEVRSMVPANKTIRESVSITKMRIAMERAQNKMCLNKAS